MELTHEELFEFLEAKYLQYDHPGFIENDPIAVPHRFSRKEDIEIAAFLTATLSWGTRTSILKDADRLFNLMDDAPYDFLRHHSRSDWKQFETFYHRTFHGTDCIFFLQSLENIYRHHGGLESCFRMGEPPDLKDAIQQFRKIFLETDHPSRSEKHLADPGKGATGKRILMFLRWMVRNDYRGVDFGLWKDISSASLMCPLDVHSGTTSRKLGLLTRKQNDWKAVEELTASLRRFDADDPVKYDFALFGLGACEKF